MYDFFPKENKSPSDLDGVISPNLTTINNICSTSEVPSTEPEKIREEKFDINSLKVDPGKRRQIWEYPVNQKDEIRRAYIGLEAYQSKLTEYPSTQIGEFKRRFQYSWFPLFPWLEYSPTKDKAFCFPFFLFNKLSGESKKNAFAVEGFDTWNKVKNVRNCSFLKHYVGNNFDSPHRKAQRAYDELKNQPQHIANVVDKFSLVDVANNHLRVMASIKVISLLALQACSFRGHDESPTSLNRGNSLEFLDVLASENNKLLDAINSAPKNAKYTSLDIHKQILHTFAIKVKNIIREKIGDSKFCLLVDEARVESKREQMSLILRFVDNKGFVWERFLGFFM